MNNFKLDGQNLRKFTTLTKILAEMDKDVTIVFTSDGAKIKIISGSVAMGIFELGKLFFKEYNFEEKKIITIDTILFQNICNKLGKKDLSIDIETDFMKFYSGQSSFKLKYYAGDEESREKPNVDFKCMWNIEMDELATLIEEHLAFSDYCLFESSEHLKTHIKNKLVDGTVVASAIQLKSPKDKEGNDIPQTSAYDIRYLSIIIKMKTLFKNVKFQFSENYPCNIEAYNDNFKFDWLLAPRIEDE